MGSLVSEQRGATVGAGGAFGFGSVNLISMDAAPAVRTFGRQLGRRRRQRSAGCHPEIGGDDLFDGLGEVGKSFVPKLRYQTLADRPEARISLLDHRADALHQEGPRQLRLPRRQVGSSGLQEELGSDGSIQVGGCLGDFSEGFPSLCRPSRFQRTVSFP
jgi:hypothetical protein